MTYMAQNIPYPYRREKWGHKVGILDQNQMKSQHGKFWILLIFLMSKGLEIAFAIKLC